MIKRIKTEELKPGMYIHDLNCGWLDHPFFSSRFKVKDEKTVERIIEHGIKEVYIDTDKGLDVPDAPTEEEVKRDVEKRIRKKVSKKQDITNPVSIEDELPRAKEIKKEAKQIVDRIMNDIRLGRQIEIEKVDHLVDRISESIFRNDQALTSLCRIKEKDEYTFMHSVSVGVLMISFARTLNIKPKTIREIGIGAILHDTGKMKIPLEILNKPGRLTEEEFKKIKEHVVYSEEILSHTPGISPVSVHVAAEHHERFDGSGYMRGLKDGEISLYGQMAAIVDVYDAMTSDRCYHKKIEPTEALRRMFEWGGSLFKEGLVHQFIKCVGIYPVGSLVRLESGLIGIVLEQGKENLLYPVVRVIYDTRSDCFIPPYTIDLYNSLKDGIEDPIVTYEDPERWHIETETYM